MYLLRYRMIVGMGMLVLVGGCRSGDSLTSWWYQRQNPEYRMLVQSIDEYARKNGLTREQAIRQLREEADRYALQQRSQQMSPSQLAGPGEEKNSSRNTSYASQTSWMAPSENSPVSPEMGQKNLPSSSSQRRP